MRWLRPVWVVNCNECMKRKNIPYPRIHLLLGMALASSNDLTCCRHEGGRLYTRRCHQCVDVKREWKLSRSKPCLLKDKPILETYTIRPRRETEAQLKCVPRQPSHDSPAENSSQTSNQTYHIVISVKKGRIFPIEQFWLRWQTAV